jgi:hypothetical protein
MDNHFALSLMDIQKMQASNELLKCNELTAQYGLSLSAQHIHSLLEGRYNALKDLGRIEFGEGILKKLIEAFCDSSYISQQNYHATLLELQDLFYYFKDESMEELSDDELIEYMENYYNTVAGGSLDYLSSASIEELCDPQAPSAPETTSCGYDTCLSDFNER